MTHATWVSAILTNSLARHRAVAFLILPRSEAILAEHLNSWPIEECILSARPLFSHWHLFWRFRLFVAFLDVDLKKLGPFPLLFLSLTEAILSEDFLAEEIFRFLSRRTRISHAQLILLLDWRYLIFFFGIDLIHLKEVLYLPNFRLIEVHQLGVVFEEVSYIKLQSYCQVRLLRPIF